MAETFNNDLKIGHRAMVEKCTQSNEINIIFFICNR